MAKKTYIAKNSIRLTLTPGKAKTETSDAIPPKVKVVEKDTQFQIEADEGEKLVKLGAAVEVESKAPAKKPAAKKTTAKATAAEPDDGDDAGKDLV